MTQNKFYPGMLDSSIELFVVENEVKAMQKGKVYSFEELPYSVFQFLKEEIAADKEAEIILKQMHPVSEYRRIEQFAHCRFGGLDYSPDFSEGESQKGEYWTCPKRGNCSAEGTLCKLPVINGKQLTKQEIKLIQLSTTTMTNEVIAEELSLPKGTFNKAKKDLYAKLNALTKQCVTRIAVLHNII